MRRTLGVLVLLAVASSAASSAEWDRARNAREIEKLQFESTVPLNITFPEAVLQDVFELLGKAASFTPTFADQATAERTVKVVIEDKSPGEALQLLADQEKLAYEVVPPSKLIIRAR